MANEEILRRLDVLWAMLEEEGYYTKANTAAEAKRIIIEQDKFIEDAFKAHPNLDLDVEVVTLKEDLGYE